MAISPIAMESVTLLLEPKLTSHKEMKKGERKHVE
jgi:hypothetical protein